MAAARQGLELRHAVLIVGVQQQGPEKLRKGRLGVVHAPWTVQSRQIGGCSRPPVAAVLSTKNWAVLALRVLAGCTPGEDACEAGHRAPALFLDGRRLVPDLQDGRRALQA